MHMDLRADLDQISANDLSVCGKVLAQAQRLFVITGAGISAESGMPTYRGPEGHYTKNPRQPLVMTAGTFAQDPTVVWQEVDQMRIRAAACQPNVAHQILAKWEREERFSGFLIVTQNIDGLHHLSGSLRVSQMHGSLWQLAAPRLSNFTEDEQFSDEVRFLEYPEMREEILQCWSEENQRVIWEDRRVPFERIPPHDDPQVRPNIVLYDESYGSRLVWVEDFIKRGVDVVLVIGCSGSVTILDQLLRMCRDVSSDCEIININPHEDCITFHHRHLAMTATSAMRALDAIMSQS
jgi:NAD-dependent SIR2 family protein deacetylase